MHKGKILYSFLAAALLFTVGCGGSGGGSQAQHMAQIPTTPVAHIGTYARGYAHKDFDTASIVWEFDNLEGLRMHQDASYLYLQFLHNSHAPNVQFFLDTDNDPDTGNLEEGGADYMVENGYLYRSTDPRKWKWQEIGPAESTIEDGKSDTIRIKLTDLQNKTAVFRADAQALDADWVPQVLSPHDGTMSVYLQKHHIDWSKITPYLHSGDKTLKLYATGGNLYMHLEQPAFPAHIQLYIDSDDNAGSGYHDPLWKSFGADYLVEDGYLYRYTGRGDWGWEDAGTVSKLRTQGDQAVLDVVVPESSLKNLSQTIRVGAELSNQDWSDTQLLPEGRVPVFRLTPVAVDAHIEISEVMAANTHTIYDPDYFNFSDWIELHNLDDKPADIGGFKLSDKLNTPKWTIPGGTVIPANGYLLIWADKKDKKKKALHTNFSLKTEGEAVALFDPNGKSVDAFEYLKQTPDISVVYKNGKAAYMQPTPGSANTVSYPSAVQSPKVAFSLAEGDYETPQTLTLSASGATIHYTTDGSIPTASSPRYTQPIAIDGSMSVRAISVTGGKFDSPVETRNYLIGEQTALPVVALAIDNRYLYDDTIGIYTVGTNGKKAKDCGDEFSGKANFMQKWERAAHMTLFERDKKAVLSQDIGLKVAGECSRIYAQKSFQLKNDDKYGSKKFAYKVFPDKKIKKYAKLKLRNAGQDYLKAHMRDMLATAIVKDRLHVAYEAYRPTVVYVNGRYWGLYNLREKKGKDYIKENFGDKKINLIEDDLVVKEGSSAEYEDEVIAYLRSHSLASDADYNYIASKIDIDNYIDYMITNIYIANADWPGTNLIYWKPQKKGTKWQWLLHDMDYSFGLHSENHADYDALGKATTAAQSEDAWPNPEWSTLLFRKLLENGGFKARFKSRFLQQLDTTFAPARVIGIIDSLKNMVDAEMDRHIARWNANDDLSYKVSTKADWEDEIDALKQFAQDRPAVIRAHLNAL